MTQRQEFSNSRVSQNWLNMISGITAATMLFKVQRLTYYSDLVCQVCQTPFAQKGSLFRNGFYFGTFSRCNLDGNLWVCCKAKLLHWDQQSQGTRFSMFMFVTLSCRKSLSENVFKKTACVFFFFRISIRQKATLASGMCATRMHRPKNNFKLMKLLGSVWVSFRTGVSGFHGGSPSSHCQRERKVGQWKTKQLGKDVHVS